MCVYRVHYWGADSVLGFCGASANCFFQILIIRYAVMAAPLLAGEALWPEPSISVNECEICSPPSKCIFFTCHYPQHGNQYVLSLNAPLVFNFTRGRGQTVHDRWKTSVYTPGQVVWAKSSQRKHLCTMMKGGLFLGWSKFLWQNGRDMDVFVLNLQSVFSAFLRYLHHIGAPAYQVQATFSSRERGCRVPW